MSFARSFAALPAARQLAEEPVQQVAVELAQRQPPERRPKVVPDDPSLRVRVVGSTSRVSR
jgi:hypothetical protein